MTIQEWFKSRVQYDSNGGQIWAINDAEYLHHVADVRGWAELIYLFELDIDKASEFYDEIGKFIAEAINDKLERERLLVVVGQSEQLVCDHQWKSRFSEKRGYWRLCTKCSKEG